MKFMNFKKIQNKKHGITALSIVLGVVLLTGSVYANYDDSKGYVNLKEGVKKLVFTEENFSLDGKMTVYIDGEEIVEAKTSLELDGDKYHTKSVSPEGEVDESYQLKDYRYDKQEDSDAYYEYESNYSFRKEIEGDSTNVKKAARFFELLVDAVVGDLKNNFILESKDKDERVYLIDVSGNQIPEIINAGLGMTFGTANYYEMNRIIEDTDEKDVSERIFYESEYKSKKIYFEEKTGENFDEHFYPDDIDDEKDNEKTWEELSKEEDSWGEKMEQEHRALFKKKFPEGSFGYMYVDENNKIYYYDNFRELSNRFIENGRMDYIVYLLGSDPYISNGMCRYSLDKKGNIGEYEISTVMSGKDMDGKKHSIKIQFKGEVYDYGTTKIDFDPKKETIENPYDKEATVEEVEYVD